MDKICMSRIITKSSIASLRKIAPAFYGTKNGKGNISSSSSSSSSEDEPRIDKRKADVKRDAEIKRNKSEAAKKLNMLLQQMVESEVQVAVPPVNLARPADKRRKTVVDMKEEKEKPAEVELSNAAKEVATTFGGDVKQTESELLAKLLNPADENAANLSDIIKGMKIDRNANVPELKSRAEQVRELLKKASPGLQQSMSKTRPNRLFRKSAAFEGPTESIDLFGQKPLGIFSSDDVEVNSNDGVANQTWNALLERDLRMAVTHPPANYFQQLILWTEQGKLWKFPIDNEQGMEAEKEVPFTEHIFLEHHLEPWCPRKGPIRHFMELVCVGLSKNHYLSAEQKKAHIDWYRDYFEEKKQLLREVNAIPGESEAANKQIQS